MTTPHDTANELLAQGRALRSLARSILRGTDGADDVVQEAFATELAAQPRADNRAGWLARVVQNLARRRLRELARRRHRHASLLPPPAAAPAADDVLAQVEVHRLVADAVLQLGEPYRRALVLRFWHDLPPRAIARRLGMPVTTVKTHLQRGLAELRQRLDRRAGRRTWLAALVPIAHPELVAGAVAGAHAGSITIAALVAMNSKLVMFAVATGLCVGVLLWQPWSLPRLPAVDQVTAGRVDSAHGDRGDARPGASPADTAAASAAAAPEPVQRTAAESAERTCTVVGRIVTDGGAPAQGARIRLMNLWESERTPPLSAAAAADGTFALAVPRQRDLIPYTFALADAPGWAVREMELGAVQDTIADRLDLGTFRLERGVAVTGRVVEADGTPLRTRARLLTWDPSHEGSRVMMYSGRTGGFADPGGKFALADRLGANPGGVWMLAAVAPSGVGWAELAFAAGQDHLDPVEIRLLPGGGVDVHVVDPDGQPIADARVQAAPYFKPIGLAPMWEPSPAAGTPGLAEVEALFVRRSDVDGHARFVNLPRRQHPRIRDANVQQRPVKAILMSAHKAGYVTNSTTVDPASDGAAPVTLTLTKQRRVAFHGVVATADGAKLAGVTVRLNGGQLSSVTDAAGRYELAAADYANNHVPFLVEGGDVPLTFAEADIPPTGDRVEHDFAVELRAPVSGRVVDQSGAPVAGVALHLGVANGVHYASVPERTGADGRFAFPDAVASHTDLWVRPPEPATAWRLEQPRPLVRRDSEVVSLQRFEGPLVDLTVAVVDGRNGAPVSPTEVELRGLHGRTADYDTPCPQITLALGAATAAQLRPGHYRATVRAGDGLRAAREFTLTADEPAHTERVELWPAVAVVGTVDASALSPGELADRSGNTRLVLLDAQKEESYAVDAAGKRLNYTPNTAAIKFGGEMTFRLERVTPNVPLRLHLPYDDLFGEAWFCAQPGADAHVTLRLLPFGRIAFVVPAGWPPGTIEVDGFDRDAWRPLRDWRRGADDANGAPIARPAGDLRWRLRLFPQGGGAVVERTGTATVRVGATTEVRVD